MRNGRTKNRLARNENGTRRFRAGSGNANGSAAGPAGRPQLVLITGGAGFIGTNLAHRLIESGQSVLILDNLSRQGVAQNLEWLRKTHGRQVHFVHGDIRDRELLEKLMHEREVSQVFHFAAQVAVTTSLGDPTEDFEINARGTLNLLEAVRSLKNPPPVLFTSTNKVYGHMSDVVLKQNGDRYEPVQPGLRDHGFSELRHLHFHSPYGCSKGAAEQYVLDYARTFGLRTAVFRMSCIYGLHQFGNEDQGWVAHFLIRALQGEPITIYGDGRQVRDVLFVEDLVDAFLLAQKHIDAIAGRVFNIGGGPGNTTSLLELLDLIGELRGGMPEVRFEPWRTADQQYYVSDTRKIFEATQWKPRVRVREGVFRLFTWLKEAHTAFGNGAWISPTAAKPTPGTPGRSGPSKRGAEVRAVRARRPPRLKALLKLETPREASGETLAKAI